jgi:hypothetical protein
MKICPLEHSQVYRRFAKYMQIERVAIKKQDDKTEYLGVIEDEQVIAVVGWQKISEDHIRLKTDYVANGFRKQGHYSRLWDSRIIAILKYEPKVLSAYCTPMSLPKYLKEGFKVVSTSKQGIAYVKKQLN